ncbi:MAG: Histidine biosynthesis bifunctional protein HisB [Candidatus Omnitrophica bacterium]|nr:Histidine biosynthesis bifunctional protein HisB [Candidatus Omnitrophota bacterium]
MPVAFLDRDGVINAFPGPGAYVTRWEEFRFLPRSKEAIALLTRGGYEVHVISNQGCVSRGLITWEGLQGLTRLMLEDIEAAGGRIAGVRYCPHRTEDVCECKKPSDRMLWDALGPQRRGEMSSAVFIGDSREDLLAARSAGCSAWLALSGRTGRADIEALGVVPDRICADLWEAAGWLVQRGS